MIRNILIAAVVLGLGFLVFMRLTGSNHPEQGMNGPTPVTVSAVVQKNAREFREFPGRLEAVDRAEIRPRISGTIDEIHFKEGALVNKGDLLFTIDPKPFEADLARAEAAVTSAKAQSIYAAAELNRAQHLTMSRDITKSQFDQRQNDARVAEANLKSAEAALETAKLNLGYTHITAPISGKIGRAEITIGNLVQTGANAPILTTIVTYSPIYTSFEIDEQTYNDFVISGGTNNLKKEEVKKDDVPMAVRPDIASTIPVIVQLATKSSPTYRGFVKAFDNEMRASSGTVRVRAILENADGILVPGMFAKVKMGNAAPADYILVNDRAIGTDQDRKFVFVVGEGNKAEYREVVLGPSIDGLRAISSGLKAGDKIVVNGLQRVRPQAVLAPAEVPMPVGEDAIPDATPKEAAAK